MRRVLTVVVLLAMTLPVTAQTPERIPTDTELHAAACIPIMQWAVESSRKAVAEYDSNIAATLALPADQRINLDYLKKGREEAAQLWRDSDSALKRLQAYLLPRYMSLDSLSIIAATNRGKADVQEMQTFIDSCSACEQAATAKNPAAPDFNACAANECKRQPPRDRLIACQNPNWLPF
jgi:hypothetical protein